MLKAKELNWLISLVKANRDNVPTGVNAKTVFDKLSKEYEKHIIPNKIIKGHYIIG